MSNTKREVPDNKKQNSSSINEIKAEGFRNVIPGIVTFRVILWKKEFVRHSKSTAHTVKAERIFLTLFKISFCTYHRGLNLNYNYCRTYYAMQVCISQLVNER